MWYVMQVRTGTEESMCRQCRGIIDHSTLERCFIPYYQEKKKYKGEWHTREKILFPGYVFLVTEQLEELRVCLKEIIGMTKLLGSGKEIVPLSEEEVALLLRLGKEEQVVEMSIGVIENSQIRIQEGPLMGMEGTIRKIDRHKRKAWLEIEMFGRIVEMQVGLEVVAKT